MKRPNIKKTKAEVSVIIANRDNGVFLPGLLMSLIKWKDNFEIIIVDDNSSDGSVVVVKEFYLKDKRIKLIKTKSHVGAAKARNIGVKASSGRYLFFLDSDTKVKKGWFREIGKFFARHPKTGVAIAKLLKAGTEHFDSAGEMISPFCFLVERSRGTVDNGQFDREDRIFSGKSAGMIIRRDIFEKINGFDESYVIFLEDTDLCWRVQLYGYEIRFLPKVTVWHDFYSGLKSQDYYRETRAYYLGSRNTMMTIFKNLSLTRLVYIFPVQILTWLMLALIQILNGRRKQGLEVLRGIYWILTNIRILIKKRPGAGRLRYSSEKKIFSAVSFRPKVSYYFGKARAYCTGQAY